MGDLSGALPIAEEELSARAEGLRGFALQRLEQLVMAESPSGNVALLGRLNDDLTRAYRAVGARVERDPGPDGDHLICHWDSGPTYARDGHVLIIGHSDTVFPAGTTADRPFRLSADGDTVTGPGVYDMKGALIEIELAMLMLADAGLPLLHPVRLVIVNDEETGSVDGRRVVAANTDGAIAAIGLEPPLPGGDLKIGRRGVARVEMIVDGVEAHAGLDEALGVSAIDELLDHLVALRPLPHSLPDAAVNIGAIEGGTRANVVAGYARAELGLRFATPETERLLLRAVETRHPIRSGAVVHTKRLSHRPAWAADPANPLAAQLRAAAAGVGMRVGTGVAAGAGDTNLTGAAGIPTVDGLGPEGSGAHATGERASIRSLLQRAALLAVYLSATSVQRPSARVVV
jgi:glutamate carboxypeptidase